MSIAAKASKMGKAAREPLGLAALLCLSFGLAAAVALYCIAYNSLAGRSEGLGTALIWALVNVVPWFLAFEAAKRSRTAAGKAGVLAAALLASMILQLLAFGLPAQPPFELVRRLPGLLLVAVLLGLIGRAGAAAPAPAAELPLLPAQIDWVAAAGNYVELHGHGRTIVHRASLSSVEAQLGARGFVRIHRSTLVRREAIARVRAVDLVLRNGTSLKLGKRYRSKLLSATAEFRPLAPAE